MENVSIKTRHIGFNLPYKGNPEESQDEGKRLHWVLDSHCFAFQFQLELGENIKRIIIGRDTCTLSPTAHLVN